MFNWRKTKKPSPVEPQQPVPPPAGKRPANRQEIFEISDGLRVHLSLTDIQLKGVATNFSCWVYRSEGLLQWGQSELLFAVPQTAMAVPVKDPVYFTQVVANFAAKGQLVSVGDHSIMGPTHPGFFGRRDFRGLGYAYPFNLEKAIPSADAVTNHLAVIALTGIEVQAARRFGLARTLAKLGEAARFYPYPTWTDPGRTEVIDQRYLNESVLKNFGGVWTVAGIAPILEQGVVRLSMPSSSAKKLAEGIALARQKKVTILLPTTAGWTSAMGCLTWQPGAQGPAAITAAVSVDVTTPMVRLGESLLGCFMGLLISDSKAQGAQMVEDGFCVFLSEGQADQVLSALQAGEQFALEGRDGLHSLGLIPDPAC